MEKSTALRQGCFPMPVGEQAVVPDFDESVGEDVEEESPDELEGGQGHGSGVVSMFGVSVLEGDLISFETDDPAVGDGAAVGVSAEVSDDVLGTSEWGLAVDVPVDPVEAVEEGAEGGWLRQRSDVSREGELPGVVGLFQEC